MMSLVHIEMTANFAAQPEVDVACYIDSKLNDIAILLLTKCVNRPITESQSN